MRVNIELNCLRSLLYFTWKHSMQKFISCLWKSFALFTTGLTLTVMNCPLKTLKYYCSTTITIILLKFHEITLSLKNLVDLEKLRGKINTLAVSGEQWGRC